MRDAIKTSDARAFVKGFKELLTLDEERTLFQSWWDTNPQGFADLLDTTNRDVVKFTGGNDDLYLTRIILLYGPLIRRSIKELSSYKMDEDELLSEGLIALAEAARRFTPSEHADVRFATYAKVCVKGTMQGFIMKQYFMVQICTNRGKKRLFYSMRRHIAIALKNHGKFRMNHATASQMATDHNLDETDVWKMYELFQAPCMSLDYPSQRDDTWDVGVLGDNIEDVTSNTEEIVLSVNEVTFHRKILDDAMKTLTPREKTVFIAQVLTDTTRTLDNLGVEFDVSKERIRQIRIVASQKVRKEVLRIASKLNIAASDIFSD
jgi:RNA polymerase sigma-32 factor